MFLRNFLHYGSWVKLQRVGRVEIATQKSSIPPIAGEEEVANEFTKGEFVTYVVIPGTPGKRGQGEVENAFYALTTSTISEVNTLKDDGSALETQGVPFVSSAVLILENYEGRLASFLNMASSGATVEQMDEYVYVRAENTDEWILHKTYKNVAVARYVEDDPIDPKDSVRIEFKFNEYTEERKSRKDNQSEGKIAFKAKLGERANE